MDVRLVTEEEIDQVSALLGIAYLDDAPQPIIERFRQLNERDRTFVAVDGDEVVGSIAAYSFDVAIPGATTLPMAGTTIVAVKPTHRRRGLLRRLMAAHFEDVTARNEPLAGLWASEAPIYGRFGYGWSTDFTDVTITTSGIELTGDLDDSVSVRMVDRDTYLSIAPGIYDQVRLGTPGSISRSKEWWDLRSASDHPETRHGASSLRYLVASRDGTPVAATHYRTKDEYEHGISKGEVRVAGVLATDLDAELAIWNVLFSIDLTTTIKTYQRPLDDPLMSRINDSRKYHRRVSDGLYLRLHDVPRALAARSYASDGALAIELTDSDTAGTYTLTVDGGTVSSERSDAAPDVSMEAQTLGSIYMGGMRVTSLAAAGRITGDLASIASLDALFLTDRPPLIRDGF